MADALDTGRFRVTEDTVRRPVRESFQPRYRIPAAAHEDLRAVERADQSLRDFPAGAVRTRALLEEALTRNAFGTASIEGNPLTLHDVESLLARQAGPLDTHPPEEREILNQVTFMERLDDHPLPGAPEDLLEIHARLFDGVLEDAGSFKQAPNFIGRRPSYEVAFIPAAPERVRPELAAALDWFHQADEHPLVRVQVLFHEFQSIHPFRDGNGRAGRALTTLCLYHLGYPGVRLALVDYAFNQDRDGYYKALSAVERQAFDYTPWITYMSSILKETFQDAAARMHFHAGLPEDLNQRQEEVALWFARMDRENPGRRVKFNDVHHAFPAVADRTLKRDLRRLREHGVLTMEGKRRGARYHLTPDQRPQA